MAILQIDNFIKLTKNRIITYIMDRKPITLAVGVRQI